MRRTSRHPRPWPHALTSILALLATFSHSALANETYREALNLSSMPDGKLHAQFEFHLETEQHDAFQVVSDNAIAHHHTHLPPILTNLVEMHRVASLDLTFSSGRWEPTWPSQRHGTPSSGIALVAFMDVLENEEGDEEEETRWEGLKASLGGLFCAGIIGKGDSPAWAYKYPGQDDTLERRLHRLQVPLLSATCTESLTPFVSLLPCGSRAGLGALLEPHKLFDGDFTFIRIAFVDGEWMLNVEAVLDPVRISRQAGGLGSRGFSISHLFGAQDKAIPACPVAATSDILLSIPENSVTAFEIEPRDTMSVQRRGGREMAVWSWDSGNLPDISLKWPHETHFRPPPPSKSNSPLTIRRLLRGHGQERGKIGVEIINETEEEKQVVWVEGWPWWLRVFVSGIEVDTSSSTNAHGHGSAQIVDLSYTPPLARARGTLLQVKLTLPPASSTTLVVPYEASYLWYTEYPPDAHRGFPVPGATVFLPADGGGGESGARWHTASTLLSLPTPDFSMPYNVIILTSTAVALFFGHVMNALVRKWRVVPVC